MGVRSRGTTMTTTQSADGDDDDESVFCRSSKTVEWIQSTGMVKSRERGTVGYLTESDYCQLRITCALHVLRQANEQPGPDTYSMDTDNSNEDYLISYVDRAGLTDEFEDELAKALGEEQERQIAADKATKKRGPQAQPSQALTTSSQLSSQGLSRTVRAPPIKKTKPEPPVRPLTSDVSLLLYAVRTSTVARAPGQFGKSQQPFITWNLNKVHNSHLFGDKECGANESPTTQAFLVRGELIEAVIIYLTSILANKDNLSSLEMTNKLNPITSLRW